jgi:predicted Zn-dependent protease
MLSESDRLAQVQSVRASLQKQHYWLAIPALQSLVADSPDCADVMELLGIAYTMANDHASAKQSFKQATRLEPGRVSSHYNFAVFLFNNNDLDEASEELQTTLFLAPTHAGALKLQSQLTEKLRFRDTTADEGFAVVGSMGRELPTNHALETLQCPVCGAMNRVMARVCKKCNSFIAEMPDLVPVE